jgi:ADP-ribosylglycohydrolase
MNDRRPIMNAARGFGFHARSGVGLGRALGAPGLVLALLMLASCASFLPPHRTLSDAEYLDRVQGSWLGKCIGGALGMPVECWLQQDIAQKYPQVNDYIGYFDWPWEGWTHVIQSVAIPKDGAWHPLEVTIKVPSFDPARQWPAFIFGLDKTFSAAPAKFEIRNLAFVQPAIAVPYDKFNWVNSNGCGWSAPATAIFDYKGEQPVFFKLNADVAHKFNLKPGDTLRLRMDGRWLAGENRLGFAFDMRASQMKHGFGPDDDTTYQVIGLHALEKNGPDLSCMDIAQSWGAMLESMPIELAEGQALDSIKRGVMPPQSGQTKCGEAIGGQMKGEIWGLVCPGRPDLAAEYARRDGVVAHFGNGVLGEQFVAVMISESFYQHDVRKLIEAGLRRIPQDSEYAKTIRWAIALHDKHPNYLDAYQEIHKKYPKNVGPVYPEAAYVVTALLYGQGDFERSICIAASLGNDADCNAATVGALLGCIQGAHALPARWVAPVGDDFKCYAYGYDHNTSISGLSRRICGMGRLILRYHGHGARFSRPI